MNRRSQKSTARRCALVDRLKNSANATGAFEPTLALALALQSWV